MVIRHEVHVRSFRGKQRGMLSVNRVSGMGLDVACRGRAGDKTKHFLPPGVLGVVPDGRQVPVLFSMVVRMLGY